jgi:flagellar hook protein FlgE
MVFSTALTGIKSSSDELAVLGNNIANAGTTGFKSSRAEFADIYTSTGGSNPVGAGVAVSSIRQQHTQGSISVTSNNLDMAISGEGFYMLADPGSGAVSYSRAGAFSLDRQGYMINGAEQRLRGLVADGTGTLSQVTTDIQLDTSSSAPNATTDITLGLNLDSGSTAPVTGNAFVGGATVNDSSYNNLTSTTIYDSLGNAHVLTTYYIKADEAAGAAADIASTPAQTSNQWYLGFQIDGNDLYDVTSVNGGAAAATNAARLSRLQFNADGSFNSLAVPTGTGVGNVTPATNGVTEVGATNVLQLTYAPGNGADTMSFNLDFNDPNLGASTQYGSAFTLQVSDQDGFATGRLEDIEVDSEGVIRGRFSNGQNRTLGQVQLAKFPNTEGLRPNGDTNWVESSASGAPTIGVPRTGSLGGISSGSLEGSNVDLTAELVALITAQRNFQANAQTIRTGDAISQTIINLR